MKEVEDQVENSVARHLSGKELLDVSGYEDVKGVRIDRVHSFIVDGYVVIEKNETHSDIVLMGKPKKGLQSESQEEISQEASQEVKEEISQEASQESK